MSDTNQHTLQQLIDNLTARDGNAVRDLNDKYCWGGTPAIEEQIWLANWRAQDALAGVMLLAKYIIEKEKENNDESDKRNQTQS